VSDPGSAGPAPEPARGDSPPATPKGSPPLSELVAAVHRLLADRGATVGVSESLTGGLLAATLAEPPGASRTFRGGLVVYATDLKASLGAVPADLLAAHGPVSPEVAAALAAGARSATGSSYGVGLTGVAGPDRQDGHDVGTVYVAVADPAGATSVASPQLAGERGQVQAAAVRAALELLDLVVRQAEQPSTGILSRREA